MYKIFALIGVFFLQGCTGFLLGTTLTGAYFLSSFTDVYDAKEEFLLEKKITKELKAIKKIRVSEVFNADVLVLQKNIFVIGIAKNQISKRYPLDYLASKYPTYKIIDEVKIGTSKNSLVDFIIKSKINTKLVLTNGVRYANYYFSVYAGEVVIIGYASNKYEVSTVLEKISSTRGVKKIVNYIEIKDLGD